MLADAEMPKSLARCVSRAPFLISLRMGKCCLLASPAARRWSDSERFWKDHTRQMHVHMERTTSEEGMHVTCSVAVQASTKFSWLVSGAVLRSSSTWMYLRWNAT